jgi:hypothetical protein
MLALCAAAALALLGVTIVSHDPQHPSLDTSSGKELRAHMQPIQPFEEQFVPDAALPGLQATDLAEPARSTSESALLSGIDGLHLERI